MNRFKWLVRRELWEHRAVWIAPAVMLGILVIVVAMGDVFLISEGRSVGFGEALALLPPERQARLLGFLYLGAATAMYLVLGTIGVVYALDALYGDRRDRSVLFWKSLPLSDAETVLAKFTVVVLLIPLIATIAGLFGQLTVAAGLSARVALAAGDVAVVWNPAILGGAMATTILIAVAAALWYAPLCAYLMLASAWAPRSPFLWAVLPPLAVWLIESLAFGTSHFSGFMRHRLFGLLRVLFGEGGGLPGVMPDGNIAVAGVLDPVAVAAGLVSHVLRFLAAPDMLLGLVGAALLLAGAIWVRRYRDETI